jgi:hypothetical protein
MTMLEKAARALAADEFGKTGSPDDEAEYVAVTWPLFVSSARAVLAAIREPDEAMLDAAYGDAIVGHGAAFTAMLDTILEGESNAPAS